MFLRISDIVEFCIIIFFSLFAIFLIFSKRGDKNSNYLITIFLLVHISYAIGTLLPQTTYLEKTINTSLFFWELLYGPSIFLYIKSILFSDFQLKKRDILHIIPILIAFLLLIIDHNNNHYFYSRDFFDIGDRLVNVPLSLIYLIVGIWLIYQFKKNPNTPISSMDISKIKWITTLLIIFFISRTIHFYFGLACLYKFDRILPWYFCIGSILINSLIILFFALFKNDIFLIAKQPCKYRKTKQPDEQIDSYMEKIILFMTSEKPYLNPDLTLEELSEKIEIPPYLISQTEPKFL